MRFISPEEIDALLPQTQCGLCGYGGCMPYAEALAFDQAAIHLCPPGGVKTLQALGELLQQDPMPFIAEMQQKEKPPLLAQIREQECIGCVKCIKACPVDAILGSAKHMHTVITDECTGCELCVPPCPVDCIDMIVRPGNDLPTEQQKANKARNRFNARNDRLREAEKPKQAAVKADINLKRQDYIAAALARVQEKRQQK